MRCHRVGQEMAAMGHISLVLQLCGGTHLKAIRMAVVYRSAFNVGRILYRVATVWNFANDLLHKVIITTSTS